MPLGGKVTPRCAGPHHDHDDGDLAWPNVGVSVVEQPYNPEWPQRVIDAAVFCSYDCLASWARQRSDRSTEDSKEPF